MPDRVVVLGGSAGSTEAIRTILAALPRDLPAGLLLVKHLSPFTSDNWLRALAEVTALEVRLAEDGQRLHPGRVHVAPADRHLVIEDGRVRLARSPRVNGWRPAIDPLFRSAALAYGARAVGVVLSGSLDDGTEGLREIKLRGGVALVQDPADALFPDMPAIAAREVAVDALLPAAELGSEIVARIAGPAGPERPAPARLRKEVESVTDRDAAGDGTPRGRWTPYNCPECGGPLWRTDADGAETLRCLVGHSLTMRALIEGGDERLESTLWAATLQFRQRANLLAHMAEREREAGRERSAELYASRAAESSRHAEVLRELIESAEPPTRQPAEPAAVAP
jgi:two-component system chemotaxis response regulator CheB